VNPADVHAIGLTHAPSQKGGKKPTRDMAASKAGPAPTRSAAQLDPGAASQSAGQMPLHNLALDKSALDKSALDKSAHFEI
jgi:hypothetical protein